MDGAVGPHPAGVARPGADQGELPQRWRGLDQQYWLPSIRRSRRSSPRRCGNHPALTEMNSTCSALASPCGAVSPRACMPQHSTEPSALTPQVWNAPALTDANSPAGGVAWPNESSPQHSTEPSVFTPQVWNHPALTEAKEPPGGVAWPTTLPSLSSLDPQHSTEPSVLTPQVWSAPALTEANSPAVEWPDQEHCRLHPRLTPSIRRAPSVLTPQVWNAPALTEANSPDGGVAWPFSFSPQHATPSSALTPHV